jgi:ABC-2 type transport system permease protein
MGPVLGLAWRTRKVELAAWVVGLGAAMAGTAASINATYGTPEKIQSYADAVTGGALRVINGHVEGIDTLGGVIQDEFGFLASFLVPLLGIAGSTGGLRSSAPCTPPWRPSAWSSWSSPAR